MNLFTNEEKNAKIKKETYPTTDKNSYTNNNSNQTGISRFLYEGHQQETEPKAPKNNYYYPVNNSLQTKPFAVAPKADNMRTSPSYNGLNQKSETSNIYKTSDNLYKKTPEIKPYSNNFNTPENDRVYDNAYDAYKENPKNSYPKATVKKENYNYNDMKVKPEKSYSNADAAKYLSESFGEYLKQNQKRRDANLKVIQDSISSLQKKNKTTSDSQTRRATSEDIYNPETLIASPENLRSDVSLYGKSPADMNKKYSYENGELKVSTDNSNFKISNANNNVNYLLASLNDKKISEETTSLRKPLKFGLGTNNLNTDDSKKIKILQQKLIDLGYLNPNIPYGYFGKITEEAVNKYKHERGLGNTGAYKGVVGNQTWTYLGLNLKTDKEEKARCSDVFDRLWTITHSQYPLGSKIAIARKNGIKSKLYENRKDIIDVGNELNVPPDLIASVIFKEQYTQSLPDEELYASSLITKKEHSYGLGATFADSVLDAFSYYGKKDELIRYVYEEALNSGVYPQFNKGLESLLIHDAKFSIYCTAYILKHKAALLNYNDNLNVLNTNELIDVLSNYNAGGPASEQPKGAKYGKYTLEYRDIMREYLFGY